MNRIGYAAVAVFVASIVLANWLIQNVGTVELPNGTHLAPVGFGHLAPSGVYAAGVTLVARDVIQRTLGRKAALLAIGAGAALSALLDPRLAVASGAAFLLGELADFAVYTPLQERRLFLAVVASGIVGGIVDSIVFLTLADIPLAAALAGLVIGKVWVQLAGAPVVVALRRATC